MKTLISKESYQRLEEERNQLFTRIRKLEKFLFEEERENYNENYKNFTKSSVIHLMQEQLKAMKSYYNALVWRIAIINEEYFKHDDDAPEK